MNSIFDIKAEEKIERLERVLKGSQWIKVGKDYLSRKPMHIEIILNDRSKLYMLANRISFTNNSAQEFNGMIYFFIHGLYVSSLEITAIKYFSCWVGLTAKELTEMKVSKKLIERTKKNEEMLKRLLIPIGD